MPRGKPGESEDTVVREERHLVEDSSTFANAISGGVGPRESGKHVVSIMKRQRAIRAADVIRACWVPLWRVAYYKCDVSLII